MNQLQHNYDFYTQITENSVTLQIKMAVDHRYIEVGLTFNRNYSATLATLQITSYALGI